MSERWEDPNDFHDEWETAVNKKKINREVRRERKEIERLAAESATVGADTAEFDAESARRHATASWYGDVKRAVKSSKVSRKHQSSSVEDEDEAGWTGGGPNQKAKKSKGKVKQAVPQYNTADEVAEALVDIIQRVPPTVKGLSTTIASLGDKLALLTKQAWNKRYKADFGTMKKFLESRSEFIVSGDEVSLAPQGSSSKTKSKAVKPKKDANSLGAAVAESSDEESEEEEDAAVGSPASPRKKKSSTKEEGGSSIGTILAILVLAGTSAGVWYYTQVLKR